MLNFIYATLLRHYFHLFSLSFCNFFARKKGLRSFIFLNPWLSVWELTGSNRRPSACKAVFLWFLSYSSLFQFFLFLSKHLSVLSFVKINISYIIICILFFTNFVCKLYANLKHNESNYNNYYWYAQAIEKWKVAS